MSGSINTRRQFLASTGFTLTSAWVALNMPVLLAAGQAAQADFNNGAIFQNISAEQALELGAIADQIIPPDETPGAVEIGVVYFMDGALGTFMAGAKPLVDEGLASWHQKAQAMNPNAERFSQLSRSEQTVLLKAEEQSALFGLLHTMVLFGMFSDPKYGGNRGEAGWKLLGFDKKHVWTPPFGYYDAQLMGSSEYAGGDPAPDKQAGVKHVRLT